MSRNLAKTPAAVSAGGGSTSLWVLRLLSATSPTSPFSATSARTDSSCRPCGVEGAAAEHQEGCGRRAPLSRSRDDEPVYTRGVVWGGIISMEVGFKALDLGRLPPWLPGFLSILHAGPGLALPLACLGPFHGSPTPPRSTPGPAHSASLSWAQPPCPQLPSWLLAKALKGLCDLHEPRPSALLCACGIPLPHPVWVQTWS